jgi:hypothetical protein
MTGATWHGGPIVSARIRPLDECQPGPTQLRAGEVRRRIEDIREAARLEEHALHEVWDYDERGRPWRE